MLSMLSQVLAFAALFQGLVWSGTPLRVTEVYEAYIQLPARGKEDPCTIEVVPKARWSQGERRLAYYMTSQDQMWVRADLDKDTFPLVVAHEYAHHVYFQTFTTDELIEWQLFWEKNILLMPREYAQSKASEGFAECYAARFVGMKSYLYSTKTLDPLVVKQIDALVLWTPPKSKNLSALSLSALLNTDCAKPSLGALTDTSKNRLGPGGPGSLWVAVVAEKPGAVPRRSTPGRAKTEPMDCSLEGRRLMFAPSCSKARAGS